MSLYIHTIEWRTFSVYMTCLVLNDADSSSLYGFSFINIINCMILVFVNSKLVKICPVTERVKAEDVKKSVGRESSADRYT